MAVPATVPDAITARCGGAGLMAGDRRSGSPSADAGEGDLQR